MKRFLSFTLAVLMTFSLLTFSVMADDEPTDDGSEILSQSFVGDLPEVGSVETHEITVNHALYPEILVHVSSIDLLGSVNVEIKDANGNRVDSAYLLPTNTEGYQSAVYTRDICYINDASGQTKTYTITATTRTGSARYKISIGTRETLAEDCCGRDNYTTIGKNTPTAELAETCCVLSNCGYIALLNGDGEWFRYTADGYTYITASISKNDSLAFEVYDAETLARVVRTTSDDMVIKYLSNTYYRSVVQTAVFLEPGRDYYIKVYSTRPITPDNLEASYSISVGYPSVSSEKVSYASEQSFSVTKNRVTNFTITVTGLPNSARANRQTKVSFNTTQSSKNASITSCRITAPNGKVCYAQYNGAYNKFEVPDILNFLDDGVPLNGVWRVQIKASQSLSGLKLRIGGLCYAIEGNVGN